ncbi:MAG: polysaccharide biosynthesis/export family protein [Acetobacteraceae bacterium]|nr:polysaccharide biosynthesis/export family protein [Acetobacteraceae bacterium]
MNPRRTDVTAIDATTERFRARPFANLPVARTARRLMALSAVAALPACSTIPRLPPAPPVPAPETEQVSALPPYRIQVGDVLQIRLLLNPELNEDVTVRPDGRISTTVAPDELAAGRTVPQLAAALRRDYSSQLQNPHITVVVRSFAPTRIFVGGEVANPGEFISVGPAPTLAEALSRAGGLRLSGDDNSVFIIRRGPNNRPEFLSTRFDAIEHARDPNADVTLAPYDVVYVPRSGIAEVYRYFNQYVQQFVPISWGFSYVVGNGGSSSGATVVQAPAVTPR